MCVGPEIWKLLCLPPSIGMHSFPFAALGLGKNTKAGLPDFFSKPEYALLERRCQKTENCCARLTPQRSARVSQQEKLRIQFSATTV